MREIKLLLLGTNFFSSYTAVFLQKRLIVVVNKLDQVCNVGGVYCDDEEEGLDKGDIVKKVQNFIREVCGCPAESIPSGVVIPVFGLWAYKARMLAKDPSSESTKGFVVNILSQLRNQPCGQGENPRDSIDSRPVQKLVRKLEKHSNILELETR